MMIKLLLLLKQLFGPGLKQLLGPTHALPKVPEQCVDLIKKYEGLRLKPYLDAVGIPTIGYGCTYYGDGKLVTMNDPPLTEARAEELLKEHVWSFWQQVLKATDGIALTENQLSALTSFSFNLGIGALLKSTLLKKLRINPNDITIRLEFQRWTKAGGVSLKGLEKRRREEADLFFT